MIVDLMFSMHREDGNALLLITHDPMLAERCDRVVGLADGRLLNRDGGT